MIKIILGVVIAYAIVFIFLYPCFIISGRESQKENNEYLNKYECTHGFYKEEK